MPEERTKFALRITPKTQALVKSMCEDANCQSQNEFIDKAIHFYASYLKTQDATAFLADVLVSVIQGSIADSETLLKRMLFKLSTELGVLTRIIASYEGLDESSLSRLRGQVVEDLKRTNGTLQLGDAIRRHRTGGDR